MPGRMITMAPQKPMISALHRRSRTRSPRKIMASTVANSGAVKPSAWSCASGVRVTAVKNIIMAATLIKARVR